MDCLLIDVHLCMYLYIYVHVYLLKQILKWNLHVWYSSKHCAISYIYLIPITTLYITGFYSHFTYVETEA